MVVSSGRTPRRAYASRGSLREPERAAKRCCSATDDPPSFGGDDWQGSRPACQGRVGRSARKRRLLHSSSRQAQAGSSPRMRRACRG